jgi:hypothetical protein
VDSKVDSTMDSIAMKALLVTSHRDQECQVHTRRNHDTRPSDRAASLRLPEHDAVSGLVEDEDDFTSRTDRLSVAAQGGDDHIVTFFQLGHLGLIAPERRADVRLRLTGGSPYPT